MGGKVQAPAGYADHVVFLYPELCEKCGTKICIEVCSGQAITPGGNGVPAFDREKCVHCGACISTPASRLPICAGSRATTDRCLRPTRCRHRRGKQQSAANSAAGVVPRLVLRRAGSGRVRAGRRVRKGRPPQQLDPGERVLPHSGDRDVSNTARLDVVWLALRNGRDTDGQPMRRPGGA